MYIGDKKVKKEVEDGTTVKFTLDDGKEHELHRELYDLMKTEEKTAGEVFDLIRSAVATKFLAQMADWELDFGTVEQIAMGLNNLARNLLEGVVARTFDAKSIREIKLRRLV